jgi:predicted ATPase
LTAHATNCLKSFLQAGCRFSKSKEILINRESENRKLACMNLGMAKTCDCSQLHNTRRVVITGGPGAGKTAVLELIRQNFCKHVKVLPESASILFGGGFPREGPPELHQAAQRAIFYVQRELEAAGDVDNPVIVLCDRGTVDGSAYWTGTGDFFAAVGTTLTEQIPRYDAVIHLRTPAVETGYNHSNPLRIESAEQASAIDARIANAWDTHPRRFFVESSPDFLTKAAHALDILRSEMPECCRQHVVPSLLARDSSASLR